MDTIAIKAFLLSVVILVAKAASLPKSSGLTRRADSRMDAGRNYYIAHACERTILTMGCDEGYIQLVHARYGRQSMSHCNNGRHVGAGDWSSRCMAPVRRTTRVVGDMCNGRETCVVPVVNMLFSDPCPTTFKYLEIYYICIA